MKIERVSVAFGAENWERDVEALRSLLGEPTMTQDGVWAQFDCGGTRVSVGVSPDVPAAALMLKVSDLEAAMGRMADAGWQTGEVVPGEHELRVYATLPDGLTVVAYQPVPPPIEEQG